MPFPDSKKSGPWSHDAIGETRPEQRSAKAQQILQLVKVLDPRMIDKILDLERKKFLLFAPNATAWGNKEFNATPQTMGTYVVMWNRETNQTAIITMLLNRQVEPTVSFIPGKISNPDAAGQAAMIHLYDQTFSTNNTTLSSTHEPREIHYTGLKHALDTFEPAIPRLAERAHSVGSLTSDWKVFQVSGMNAGFYYLDTVSQPGKTRLLITFEAKRANKSTIPPIEVPMMDKPDYPMIEQIARHLYYYYSPEDLYNRANGKLQNFSRAHSVERVRAGREIEWAPNQTAWEADQRILEAFRNRATTTVPFSILDYDAFFANDITAFATFMHFEETNQYGIHIELDNKKQITIDRNVRSYKKPEGYSITIDTKPSISQWRQIAHLIAIAIDKKIILPAEIHYNTPEEATRLLGGRIFGHAAINQMRDFAGLVRDSGATNHTMAAPFTSPSTAQQRAIG